MFKQDAMFNRQHFIKTGMVIFLIAAQLLCQKRMAFTETSWISIEREEHIRWSPKVVEVLSLDHLPTVIDWLWMKAMQNPNVSHVPPGVRSQLYFDLNLVTDLDPRFYNAYLHGGNFLAIIRNDVLGARDLLEKGRRHLEIFNEQAWTLDLALAYVHLFEFQDLDAAASLFREASKFQAAPPYLSRLADRLGDPTAKYEVGLRVLDMVLAGTRDSRIRSELEEKKLLWRRKFL